MDGWNFAPRERARRSELIRKDTEDARGEAQWPKPDLYWNVVARVLHRFPETRAAVMEAIDYYEKHGRPPA